MIPPANQPPIVSQKAAQLGGPVGHPEGQVRKCPISIPPKSWIDQDEEALLAPHPQETTKWCTEPVGSGQTRLRSPGQLLEGTLGSSLGPRPANLSPTLELHPPSPLHTPNQKQPSARLGTTPASIHPLLTQGCQQAGTGPGSGGPLVGGVGPQRRRESQGRCLRPTHGLVRLENEAAVLCAVRVPGPWEKVG